LFRVCFHDERRDPSDQCTKYNPEQDTHILDED
jgi:hypothetical protein